MDIVSILGAAFGSAWLSGLNLYATVAVLGLLGRFAKLPLPGDLNVLTNWWVIGFAIGLYAIEFFADKIPYFDSIWDVIHTFVRIPAGAVLAAGAFGSYSKEVQVMALLAGGALALSSHSAKAATRLALNTSPEPITNWTASFLEDGIAIGGTFLAVYFPWIILIIIVVFLIIFILVAPKVVRGLKRLFASIRRRFRPAVER